MFSSAKLTLFSVALAAFRVASANPIDLATRQSGTCTPVFNGAQTVFQPLDITDVVNQWLPDPNPATAGGHVRLIQGSAKEAFATGEFLVEQTGQPDGTFVIKLAADTSLVLSSANNDFAFSRFSDNTRNTNPQFTITCATCPDPGAGGPGQRATGCTIRSVANGNCVTGFSAGNTLTLQQCNGIQQTFSITN